MTTPRDLHNELAGPLIRSIITPMMQAGGDYADVLTLLETVAAGVLVTVFTAPGNDEELVEAFCEGLTERIAEMRAKPQPRMEDMPDEF